MGLSGFCGVETVPRTTPRAEVLPTVLDIDIAGWLYQTVTVTVFCVVAVSPSGMYGCSTLIWPSPCARTVMVNVIVFGVLSLDKGFQSQTVQFILPLPPSTTVTVNRLSVGSVKPNEVIGSSSASKNCTNPETVVPLAPERC